MLVIHWSEKNKERRARCYVEHCYFYWFKAKSDYSHKLST